MTIQLMYHSHATSEFSTDDLLKLLFEARMHNQARHITGLLLHCRDEFIQVLEGDAEFVDSLFEKISNDPRHHRVTLFQRKEIERKEFVQWSQLDDSVFSHDARRLVLCFKALQRNA